MKRDLAKAERRTPEEIAVLLWDLAARLGLATPRETHVFSFRITRTF
jgi:hypothetical protein